MYAAADMRRTPLPSVGDDAHIVPPTRTAPAKTKNAE